MSIFLDVLSGRLSFGNCKKILRTNSNRIFQEMILNSIFVCYRGWNISVSLDYNHFTELHCMKCAYQHTREATNIGLKLKFELSESASESIFHWFKKILSDLIGWGFSQEVELQQKLPTTRDSQGRTSSTSGNSPMPVRRCGF